MNNALSNKQMDTVQDIIVDVLAIAKSQITPESRLKEDLGADSLHRIEIAMKLEEEFELSMPDVDWDGISTVDEIYESVAELLDQARETKPSSGC